MSPFSLFRVIMARFPVDTELFQTRVFRRTVPCRVTRLRPWIRRSAKWSILWLSEQWIE